jgi:hypothetical protein
MREMVDRYSNICEPARPQSNGSNASSNSSGHRKREVVVSLVLGIAFIYTDFLPDSHWCHWCSGFPHSSPVAL